MNKISIYTSGFNLLANNFDVDGALLNFTNFADEVVICVNSSTDETLFYLLNKAKLNEKIKIIESDFSYDDPLLDGKIKNEALQNTSYPIKIGLDMDERIPLRHKLRWERAFLEMKIFSVKSMLIPSVNLWGDIESVKSDLDFNLRSRKWYLHEGGCFRGAVNFARKPDGTIDTSKSDSCELLDKNGNLVNYKTVPTVTFSSLPDYFSFLESFGIFVFHLGYASYEDRVSRNKAFWKKHWEVESGGIPPTHKVHLATDEFQDSTVPHGLPLWDNLGLDCSFDPH